MIIDLADGKYHHVVVTGNKLFIDGRQCAEIHEVKECSEWVRFPGKYRSLTLFDRIKRRLGCF